MADIVPHVFDESGARRLVAVAKRVEAMPRNLHREAAPQPYVFVATKFLCKNSNSVWTKGTTRDINVYAGTQGSETDTGQTLAGIYNRFSDIAANSWIFLEDVGGWLEIWVATPSC